MESCVVVWCVTCILKVVIIDKWGGEGGVWKMANSRFLAHIEVIDVLLSLKMAAILENTCFRFHSLQPSICHLPQPAPVSLVPSAVTYYSGKGWNENRILIWSKVKCAKVYGCHKCFLKKDSFTRCFAHSITLRFSRIKWKFLKKIRQKYIFDRLLTVLMLFFLPRKFKRFFVSTPVCRLYGRNILYLGWRSATSSSLESNEAFFRRSSGEFNRVLQQRVPWLIERN